MSELRLTEADQRKILAHAAPALLTLFRMRREQVIARLTGKYRNNEELLGTVAELAAYEDLTREFEQMLAKGQ